MDAQSRADGRQAEHAGAGGEGRQGGGQPERHFPLSVVIGRGIFAVVTIVLVLLTVLGVGAS